MCGLWMGEGKLVPTKSIVSTSSSLDDGNSEVQGESCNQKGRAGGDGLSSAGH